MNMQNAQIGSGARVRTDARPSKAEAEAAARTLCSGRAASLPASARST